MFIRGEVCSPVFPSVPSVFISGKCSGSDPRSSAFIRGKGFSSPWSSVFSVVKSSVFPEQNEMPHCSALHRANQLRSWPVLYLELGHLDNITPPKHFIFAPLDKPPPCSTIYVMPSELRGSASASLTSEIEGLYNQSCCRRQVTQLVFCRGCPDLFGGVAQVVRATVS